MLVVIVVVEKKIGGRSGRSGVCYRLSLRISSIFSVICLLTDIVYLRIDYGFASMSSQYGCQFRGEFAQGDPRGKAG